MRLIYFLEKNCSMKSILKKMGRKLCSFVKKMKFYLAFPTKTLLYKKNPSFLSFKNMIQKSRFCNKMSWQEESTSPLNSW